MILYRTLRPLARLALKTFFRKIYFTNAHLVPKDKPVILASNHPTAFIEPCIIACLLDRPMHFIVRGDLFKKAFYRALLMDLNMIPIFRFVDGYSNLKNNFETMDFVYQALNDDKLILILAEGRTIQEKRLRPIQKGTARMAFGAWDKHGTDLDIHVVPVGVNYTHADKFRSEVMVDFGEPIVLRDYLESYKTNDKKAIRNLTSELTEKMEACIVNIKEVSDEDLTEKLFTIYRNSNFEKVLPRISKTNTERLKAEQKIADQINFADDKTKANISTKVEDYFSALEVHKVDDFGVVNSHWNNAKHTIILVLGFIPALLGFILNFLPTWLAKRIADVRVKQLEFYASVQIAVAIGGYIVYFLLSLIIGAIFGILGTWQFWIFLILIPIWGYVFLWYNEFYQKWRSGKAFKSLSDEQKSALKQKRRAINAIKLPNMPSSSNATL